MSKVKTIVIGKQKLDELSDEEKIDLLEQTFMTVCVELNLRPEQIKGFLSDTLEKISDIEKLAKAFADLAGIFASKTKKEGNETNGHQN